MFTETGSWSAGASLSFVCFVPLTSGAVASTFGFSEYFSPGSSLTAASPSALDLLFVAEITSDLELGDRSSADGPSVLEFGASADAEAVGRESVVVFGGGGSP